MTRAGLMLHILLATVIAVAGMPVHGAMSAPGDSSTTSIDSQPVSSSENPCPHQADVEPTAADVEVDLPDCMDENGCCAGDCVCQCAGLTLVVPLKFGAIDLVLLADQPVDSSSFLTSLTPDLLLRPPQS
jgi:hypothetical protein